MLIYSRLVMFVLIGIFYLNIASGETLLLKGYVVLSIGALMVNHFFIFPSPNKGRLYALILLDGAISFLLGFVFPENSLYLILLGVVAVTLCVHIAEERLLKRAAWLFFSLWSVMIVSSFFRLGDWYILENLISASFVGFGAIVGRLIRKLMDTQETLDLQYKQLEESHVALTDAHQQLQVYAEQVENWTAVKERNRMARDIHDTVGHKMTALLVQLELAREWNKQHDQAKVADTLVTCDDLARGALGDIRLSVRTLQHSDEEQLGMVETVRRMLTDFYQLAHIQASLDIKGDPSIIPVSLQPTMIRMIQESLTNAKRHGNASKYEVSITCDARKITLCTKDNGQGTSKIVHGFGLMNIQERVREHGGTVMFTSEAGEGFRLEAEFPLLERTWKAGQDHD